MLCSLPGYTLRVHHCLEHSVCIRRFDRQVGSQFLNDELYKLNQLLVLSGVCPAFPSHIPFAFATQSLFSLIMPSAFLHFFFFAPPLPFLPDPAALFPPLAFDVPRPPSSVELQRITSLHVPSLASHDPFFCFVLAVLLSVQSSRVV